MSGAFAGLSYSWWSHKHNRHHNAPNQEGKDPDIGPGALAFTPAIAADRSGWVGWFTRQQGYLFFPLLLLEGANLHLASVRTLLRPRDLKHRRLELTLILARLGSYLTALFLLLPPPRRWSSWPSSRACSGCCSAPRSPRTTKACPWCRTPPRSTSCAAKS